MSISDVYAQYELIRENNRIEEQKRQREITEKIPGYKKLQNEIKGLQKKRILEAFTAGKEYDNKISALIKDAEDLLVSNGFPSNYLEPFFTCDICKDNGVTENGERCSCFKKRVLEDKLKEARLLDTNISFKQFDLNIFDNKPIKNGKSQRDYMKQYKKIFEAYADDFPDCPSIVLISGGIGLGKTFISKCIMRRVIERGYTTAYYTAYRLFSMFHQHRLGEDVDLEPLFEVPLLIIDDIGTEPMTKNVTREYFFDLLNERTSLHTILITNLTFDELDTRYGERIYSRLMEKNISYRVIFEGDDIRRSK